jgi:hypothetical protein
VRHRNDKVGLIATPVDPKDLIHYGAATVAGLRVTEIGKRMLGPALDELAERFRDRVRVYRYGRQLQLVEKAQNMAERAGYSPRAVPLKLLFPLLEKASLEEDEDLHTKWAALLANAANPNTGDRVLPSFIEVLPLLTNKEAKLLDSLYAKVKRQIATDRPVTPAHDLGIFDPPLEAKGEAEDEPARIDDFRFAWQIPSVSLGKDGHIFRLFSELGFTGLPPDTDVFSTSPLRVQEIADQDNYEFRVLMSDLVRLGMIVAETTRDRYYFTPFGAEFIAACTDPSKFASRK